MNRRLVVYLLALGAFITGTAELVVAGMLNVIADDLHISVAAAGQLISAYSLPFAIGTPILIALTARMQRKRLIIASLVLFTFGSLVSLWSPNYTVLFVSRIVLGISAGIYSVVAVGSIAKLVPPERIGSAVSLIALGFGFAMALGVPLGVAAANAGNWRAIFAVLGLISLIVTFALLRLLPHVEGDAPVPFLRRFAVLGHPVVASGLLMSLLLNASNSAMMTYLAPYLQNVVHLRTAEVGWSMLAFGVFGIAGSRLGGFGVDRWGAVRIIAVSLSLSAALLLALPLFAASALLGLLLIALWFTALFMNAPALQTYFIQQDPESGNLVLGLNLSIVHLGIALGAGAGGVVADAASTVQYNPWTAGLIAALGLAAAAASFSMRRRIAPKPA
ncbi:MFS transporter [Paenibacillus sp. GYB003]|uniref:MFS transporter n=1 Tax=Paenibacillus sp. GYB003 TaxID=2994392 RepID=UPI002F96876F